MDSLDPRLANIFDPCEKDNPGNTSEPCHPELRLVFQPVLNDSLGLRATDAAIHLIFDLGGYEYLVVESLAALKAASPNPTAGITLGTHPGFSGNGISGAWATDLITLVKSFAGRQRLTIASIIINDGSNEWRFGRAAVAVAGGA